MATEYTIRYLETVDDYKQLLDLKFERSSMIRTKNAAPEITIGGKVTGAFLQDGSLVASLQTTLWDNLAFYSLGDLHIKKGHLPRYDFSIENNPVVSITDFILGNMENRGYYSWFYSRALSPAYHKIQKDGNDLLTQSNLGKRYERFVTEFVPAGQRAKTRVHDNMLLRRTWERNIVIVMCSLKNEFRPYGDVFDNESKYYA